MKVPSVAVMSDHFAQHLAPFISLLLYSNMNASRSCTPATEAGFWPPVRSRICWLGQSGDKNENENNGLCRTFGRLN
jgi:hypothetical protein